MADTRRRPVKRLSSPERWEAKQLIASGVLPVEEYPTFDAENDGLLAYEEEAEQEVEIEINEDEAPFLAGQTPQDGDVSPIKIVKNPDGSLQRARRTAAQDTLDLTGPRGAYIQVHYILRRVACCFLNATAGGQLRSFGKLPKLAPPSNCHVALYLYAR